jgi:hypothetical protein
MSAPEVRSRGRPRQRRWWRNYRWSLSAASTAHSGVQAVPRRKPGTLPLTAAVTGYSRTTSSRRYRTRRPVIVADVRGHPGWPRSVLSRAVDTPDRRGRGCVRRLSTTTTEPSFGVGAPESAQPVPGSRSGFSRAGRGAGAPRVTRRAVASARRRGGLGLVSRRSRRSFRSRAVRSRRGFGIDLWRCSSIAGVSTGVDPTSG